MTLAGLFCFIGNFSFPIKQKTLREDAHLAEKKLAVNSTARARKSRKRLFVLYDNRMFAEQQFIVMNKKLH